MLTSSIAPRVALIPNLMPCASKAGPGRAGDAGQPILISKDDLSIGADYQYKGEGLPLKTPRAQDSRYNVSPLRSLPPLGKI